MRGSRREVDANRKDSSVGTSVRQQKVGGLAALYLAVAYGVAMPYAVSHEGRAAIAGAVWGDEP